MKSSVILFAILFTGITALKGQTILNIHKSNGTVLQFPLNSIDSITYTTANSGNLAVLSTIDVGSITSDAISSGGNIIDDGGSPVTQRGVVWSLYPNPSNLINSTNDGIGAGMFNSSITGLQPNTVYFIRAYAINSSGTSYGNELSFTTAQLGGNVVSNPGSGVTFDGYTYPSVIIGNGQEWMSENLHTAIYSNGDPIPNVMDSVLWANLNSGAWVHYDNDSQNENTFGKLYNWYTVTDSRNVCPTGWHVPTDGEWSLLINYLDPSAAGGDNMNNTAGARLKSTGTQIWQSPNVGATNESGFSALPGGARGHSNYEFFFSGIYGAGIWWSSTEYNTNVAWTRAVGSSSTSMNRSFDDKTIGLSVRCVKD